MFSDKLVGRSLYHCYKSKSLFCMVTSQVDVAHAALIRSNLSPKESRSSFLEVSWQPPPVKLLQSEYEWLLS